MRTLTGVALIVAMTGCLPLLDIPEPYPVRTTSYELDKDTQKWTQQTCTTTMKNRERHELETICYKQSIASPPPGVVKP